MYDNITIEQIEEIAARELKDIIPFIMEIKGDSGYSMYLITGDEKFILTDKHGADTIYEAINKELRDKYGITD